jgi:hypothetical protein
MIKAYSDARNRCYIHPHRQAGHRCERCGTGLCDECDHVFRDQHLCQHCIDEIEYAEATKPTFRDHVRETLTNFRNGLIVALIIAALAGGAFYLLHDQLNQPITPEEMARFRYAVSGGFQTPEGVNVNSTVLDAKIVSFSSQRVGYEASHLINELTIDSYPGWRSADTTFPQDIVVEHQDVSQVSKVILEQQPAEPPSTWARRFEIDVSTTSPTQGWTTVGTWELAQVNGVQRFTFPPVDSKWIRLRILSNYGSTAYTSLDEFDAYVIPAGSAAAMTATASP